MIYLIGLLCQSGSAPSFSNSKVILVK